MRSPRWINQGRKDSEADPAVTWSFHPVHGEVWRVGDSHAMALSGIALGISQPVDETRQGLIHEPLLETRCSTQAPGINAEPPLTGKLGAPR